MRRLRYQVAATLDGFIAGPHGEIDWIVGADEFDFGALFAQFDTLLMGRRTYEGLEGGTGMYGRKRVIVASGTLRPEDHPAVEIVAPGALADRVRDLKQGAGKDIWLFGGGRLFRSLLDAGLVDTVEPAVIPVLIGDGIPLLPGPQARHRLKLRHQQQYGSGMLLLEYDVVRESGDRPRRGAT